MIRHAFRIAAIAALAGACTLVTGGVAAQESVAKPTCKRPEYPGRAAGEDQAKANARLRSFNTEVETFAACIKQYVADQQRLADEHIKAANAAAADYNSAVKEIQAQIDKDKQ